MKTPHTTAASERAHADLDSVLDLTRNLVRVPTRAGIDPIDVFTLKELCDLLDPTAR